MPNVYLAVRAAASFTLARHASFDNKSTSLEILKGAKAMKWRLMLVLALCIAPPSVAQTKDGPIRVEEIQYLPRPAYAKPQVTDERPAGPVIRGAGVIEFDFDPADFPPAMLKRIGLGSLNLELGFDSDGVLSSCIPMGYGYQRRRGQMTLSVAQRQFCDVAATKMRFRYDPGYILDALAGYLAVKVNWNKRLFPAKPFKIGSGKDTIPVDGHFFKSGKGGSAQCTIWTSGLSASEEDGVCAMLGKSRSFQKKLAAF